MEFSHGECHLSVPRKPAITASLQGGNRIEIMLSGRLRGYGGMKLDPIVIEKR